MDESERQARIVRYWRAVEYFSPPRVDPVDPRKNMRAVHIDRPLPWDAGVLPAPRQNKAWRHTVYAGIYDVAKVREVLQNMLRAPEIEIDFGGRNSGKSALLSFAVDSGGQLIKDSVTLSSCAWAVSRTLAPGPGSDSWLDGFDEDQKRLMAVCFEFGDGRIPIDNSPAGGSAAGRGLGQIAGMAARVALDIATGGISSLPALLSAALEPAIGALGTTVVENIGDNLAARANESVTAAVEQRRADSPESEGGVDSDQSEVDGDSPQSRALCTKVLAVPDLVALTRLVAESLDVAEVLRPDSIRIKSIQIPLKSAEEMSSDDFLNSFHADDLDRVADALSIGDAGEALRAYLCSDEVDVERRVDVRADPRSVLRSVGPASAPAGRWPSDPARPLTLSQQFAVNQIRHRLSDPGARGIYAVNGPPGTGKTTMLRDLVAAVVVERAQRLARLDSARAAFEKSALRWESDDSPTRYIRSIHRLAPDLTGFEIVVASSNNGAVENVTLEMPVAKAVDARSFPDARYLSDPATLLTGTPCWGSIAARLGRRPNRAQFVDRFWWGKETGSGRGRNAADLRGLQRILKDLQETAVPGRAENTAWSDAVAEFDAACAAVARLASERQDIADILDRVSEPDARLAELRHRAENDRDHLQLLRSHRDELRAQLEQAHADYRGAERAVRDARATMDRTQQRVERMAAQVRIADSALHHQMARRPGLLRRMWTRSALGDWEQESRPLAAALEQAVRVLDEAEAVHQDSADTFTARQRDLSEAVRVADHCRDRLAECERDLDRAVESVGAADNAVQRRRDMLREDAEKLEQARLRWPGTVPGNEWDAAPDERAAMERRENSSPWMDEEYAAARSQVLIAALNLHRAVLTAEPALMWHNMRAAMDVVSGDAPADLPEETILAAWQMLFFVVPVVSTTFASLPRMFAKLGREALGWLFIDEAGQAAPQEAVGALWRSQRAVVVGDPRQLEPVITLPLSGQKRLCRQFEVDPQWVPQNMPVQSVADRLNPFGTWLSVPDSQGAVWVGSPLRVHRRCDRLMFEVSNKIAYDEMMVYGVTSREPFDLLAQSTWLDVGAEPSGEKWNPAEGRYVVATLDTIRDRISRSMDNELARAGLDLPDWAATESARGNELARRTGEAVFVVSPFRDVVYQLQRVVEHRLPGSANRVGTVHTTQGKEADVVILVLGTATDQRKSRDWASHPPNLLNVAVTRARRCLVVVGDYKNWSDHRNFGVLAAHGRDGSGGLLTVVDVATEWSSPRQPET
ncbi:DEAD/DEAH box helicase [Nocardia sp. NBC_01329]|uniref:DEAD/DEAH box helicase n=1 Tax=Nocardia sp. NBC_01329 TaxID=2903594 RepID=UPI002E1496A4|nr:AAA domain-containing protein [Nocardia sp. NBC_01329]